MFLFFMRLSVPCPRCVYNLYCCGGSEVRLKRWSSATELGAVLLFAQSALRLLLTLTETLLHCGIVRPA